MKLLFRIITSLIRLILWPDQRRFVRALKSPDKVQAHVLTEIVRAAAKTTYGKSLKLESTADYDTFKAKVPLTTYDKLNPWITYQRDEKLHDHLTPGDLVCYEPTSGSSGQKKLIPYNRPLLESFSVMLRIWMGDILSQLKTLKSGGFYFLISPSIGEADDLGLSDDSSYASGVVAWILRRFSAVTSDLKKVDDTEWFFEILSCQLLAREDLEIISVWNPSFLLQLLSSIKAHKLELLALLPQGKTTYGGLTFHWKIPSAKRLQAIHNAKQGSDLWPALRLISCWDCAEAGMPARALQGEFPKVWVQGKGLLATEAPITLPFQGQELPLLNEVFLEFLSEDGDILRLHELRLGQSYELVISQKGGLLRYRIGDRVTVTGFKFQTPALRFKGRSGARVDMFGEKLEEGFVRAAIRGAGGSEDRFWACLPQRSTVAEGYYLLLTDQMDVLDESHFDREFRTSHHYAVAQKLRQLKSLRLIQRPDARQFFLDLMAQTGRKIGDLKGEILVRHLQSADFIGRHLNAAPMTSEDSEGEFA